MQHTERSVARDRICRSLQGNLAHSEDISNSLGRAKRVAMLCRANIQMSRCRWPKSRLGLGDATLVAAMLPQATTTRSPGFGGSPA
jgi:hypothetical protein